MPDSPQFADVAVPVGVATIFTYLIPEDLRGRVAPGHRIPVVLGRRKTHGYVVRLHDGPAPERLRPVGVPDPAEPVFAPDILDLTRWVADYYLAPWGEVLEAAAPRGRGGARKTADAQTAAGGTITAGAQGLDSGSLAECEAPPILMPEQQEAYRGLHTALARGGFEVHLLQGVPGSGKTEIYLALIADVLNSGGSALLLEPEIGIATQILSRVRLRFGDRVGLYHSQTGTLERRRTWEEARRGRIDIVVGARSAVFVPLPNLRLVIVDEEQEPAYKQEESPRYNGRDVAIVRARNAGALVVLGSATPSLEAWWNVRTEKFRGHRLSRRFADRPSPAVRIVDLRKDPGLPPSGSPVPLFSGLLVQKVLERLRRKEQSILFLNRRGHSTIVQCTDCGEMIRCSRCDVVLTYHRATQDLRCHHCGLVVKGSQACPSCKGERLFYGGTGTQKLEERLAELFPHARLLRLDADSTRRRGSHADSLRAIEAQEIDILLGTQMVAKGFHFPQVTLVGVLQADRAMGVPEMRAAERAYHLLTQVAGRAGRGETPGEVVFQTLLPDHYVIRAASEGNFDSFAEEELAQREKLAYPPFTRMIHLLFDGRIEENVRRRAEAVGADLAVPARRSGVELLGPAPMFLTRLKGRYRWHLTLKGSNNQSLHRLARWSMELPGPAGTRGVRVHVDVDPVRTL